MRRPTSSAPSPSTAPRLALNPNDADAHIGRGRAWHAAGHPGHAIAHYSAAIACAPRSALAYRLRGDARRDTGYVYRTIADYDEALRLAPDDAETYLRRGEAFRAQGDRKRALADYEAALRLKPALITALRPIGHTWFIEGEFALAAELLRFSEIDPDPYAVLYRYQARRRAGEDAAAELAADAAKLKSKAWPYPLIELYLGQRTPQEVIEIAAGQPQEHIEAHFHIGQWHMLRGDFPSAQASLRTVTARYPHYLAECTIARADLKRLRKLVPTWEPRVRAVASINHRWSASRTPR